MDFDEVVSLLTRRDRSDLALPQQPKIELLMNFSYEAVRRVGGVLESEKDYAAKQGQIESMNTFLGGEWWQEVYRSLPREQRAKAIFTEYAARIGRETQFKSISASVGDRVEHEPAYELVLFTRHYAGLWSFNEALSKTREKWLDAVAEAAGGLMPLDAVPDEDGWVRDLADNIRGVLERRGEFIIEAELTEVLGDLAGLVRNKHFRKAISVLNEEGLTDTATRGQASFQKVRIRRAPAWPVTTVEPDRTAVPGRGEPQGQPVRSARGESDELEGYEGYSEEELAVGLASGLRDQLLSERLVLDVTQAGLYIVGLDLPEELMDPELHSLEVHEGQRSWEPYDQYEGGIVLGSATVPATVRIDGFVNRDDLETGNASSYVEVDEEYGEDLVWVLIERTVELKYQATVNQASEHAELGDLEEVTVQ